MSVIILLSGVFRVNNQGRQFWGLEGPDRDNCNEHAGAMVVVVAYTGHNFGAISAYTLVHLLHLLIVQQFVSLLSLCTWGLLLTSPQLSVIMVNCGQRLEMIG